MIKRTLYFGNPAYLHLQQLQLVVEYPEENLSKSSKLLERSRTVVEYPEENLSKSSKLLERSRTVPIEDIGIVVIDHPQVSLSHGVANALIKNNAAILWCDEKHLPNGLVLPMSANHTYTEKLRHQLNASEPLKKQLWKQTIEAKISNQAAVLKACGMNHAPLERWAGEVTSGDAKNTEAQASVHYWKEYFGGMDKYITRGRYGAPPNNALNYGYAILRAVIARSLVASGCLPAVGIFHRNKYNAFCLADDVMEPYRPIVDFYLFQLIKEAMSDGFSPHRGDTEEYPVPDELTTEWKQKLLKIPALDVTIDGMQSPLLVAAQRTTASLMDCYEGVSRKMNYPEM